ncbi:Endoplasmic reticulum oxidoreductin-1, partial [Capsicum annuum]
IEVDNPWTNDDETDNGEMAYVNLLLNLERYTDASGEICQEKKVLYKLISGLHSSISIHIAADYLLDKTTKLCGTNPDLMYGRVLQYLEHVRNLYFTYLFVLRVVTKVKSNLERAEYDTGNPEEDLKA